MINALSYDHCQEIILSRYPGALYIVIDAPDPFIGSNVPPFICGFIAIMGTPCISRSTTACQGGNSLNISNHAMVGTPPISSSPVCADYWELLSICY